MSQGDDRRAHRVTLDHTEASLLNEEYKIGVKLPPGRDLAKELGMSHGAVRGTIRVLQAQGILESYPGPGCGARIIAGHMVVLGHPFWLHLALSFTSALDLTDTRMVLERLTVTPASYYWDDEALDKLGDLVDRMDQEITLDEFNTLDTDFHVETALMVHSPFVEDLSFAIRQVMRAPTRDTSMAVDDQ